MKIKKKIAKPAPIKPVPIIPNVPRHAALKKLHAKLVRTATIIRARIAEGLPLENDKENLRDVTQKIGAVAAVFNPKISEKALKALATFK